MWKQSRRLLSTVCATYNGLKASRTGIQPVLAACTRQMSTDKTGEQRMGDASVSRYSLPYRSDLSPKLLEKLDEFVENLGFVPNCFTAMAHHPTELEAMFAYFEQMMEEELGSLTMAEREMIIVVTSRENQNRYCVIHHAAMHRAVSGNPDLADEIVANPLTATLTPREKAIVAFTLKIVHCQPLVEDDFVHLTEHSLDREDAWYIAAISSFMNMLNRMVMLADVKPNKEFFMLGRIPPESS